MDVVFIFDVVFLFDVVLIIHVTIVKCARAHIYRGLVCQVLCAWVYTCIEAVLGNTCIVATLVTIPGISTTVHYSHLILNNLLRIFLPAPVQRKSGAEYSELWLYQGL